MKNKIIVYSFLMFFSLVGKTQTNLDSLWRVWEDVSTADTSRVQSLYKYIHGGCLKQAPDSAILLSSIGKKFAQRKGLDIEVAKMMRIEAICISNKGEFDKALQINNQIISLLKGSNAILEIEDAYERIGHIYFFQSEFDKALKFGLRKLVFEEKRNNLEALAKSYNNVGAIYKALENYEKALSYYLKTLDLYLKTNNKSGIATAYSNISTIYFAENDIVKAMYFTKKSLKIREELNYKYEMIISYFNIALNYQALDTVSEYANNEMDNVALENRVENIKLYNNDKAREYYYKAINISEDLNNQFLNSVCYLGLGDLEYSQGNLKIALKRLRKGLAGVTKVGNKGYMYEAQELIYKIYKEKEDYGRALQSYEALIELKDSISSEENLKGVLEQEFKYDYEKKAAIDSIENRNFQKIKEVQIAKQKEELKNKRFQQYLLFGGLGFMLLFSVYIIKKNKEVKAQKKEVEKQRELAEEQQQLAESQKEILGHQNQEIKDSIQYAQNLQSSVLPSKLDVKNNFPNNFVLYKPKDVVSGDFYWTYEKNELKYLAVVDCTGHGVPGAFMTIVSNNLLNEIIQENFNTPKEIVEELHLRIKIRVGGHKDAQVRDSMDLGLFSYNEKTNEVLFVGTHTSLSLVRNSKLETIKGSKADIGYKATIAIEEKRIIVQKNDMLYMHSDGFPDQKGGIKGKKFYYKPIREKFEEISLINLMEQEQIMAKVFEDWKGETEQLDDVCMIGVRI